MTIPETEKVTYRRLPSNLPAIIRSAGLNVIEIDGWATRGRPASTGEFNPQGVLVHHTGGSSDSRAYVDWMTKKGRSDLPAPLCQLALDRKGTVYVCASGRANHGGKAKASGPLPSGDANALYIGIEALNTGSEGWGKAQYDAYVKLCAVLCTKVLGNKSDAYTRAHKETSITGKWDPGKLDMHRFRSDIRRIQTMVTPVKQHELRFLHASLQFSDTLSEMRHDVDKIFSIGHDVITWTEAHHTNPLPELIKTIGAARGYHVYAHPQGLGVAVKKSIVKKVVKTGFVPVIKGGRDQYGNWSDRGIAWMSFLTTYGEEISVGAVHYLTRGRDASHGWRFTENIRYAREISKWAKYYGVGTKLAFIAGDMNMHDRPYDVFFDEPLTTCWDELKKYPNTHEKGGTIDAIASFDSDTRVSCKNAGAWADIHKKFYTDHNILSALYLINEK